MFEQEREKSTESGIKFFNREMARAHVYTAPA